MSEHPSFVTEVEAYPIPVKVFSTYSEENYDTLDQLAKERGYLPVESGEKFETEERNVMVGLQNSSLHHGWVATFDSYDVKARQQVALLKEKIAKCKANGEDVIIGFCQTGRFSIGYTIYVKGKTT